jgi:tetratricopeptide (TPR) repeat protein
MYRQVLLLEPNNVQAMVDLARAISLPAVNGFVTDPIKIEKQVVEGRDLALKAKELDPNNQSIYATLSVYAAIQGDYKESRRAAETALALDPKNPGRYSDLADDYIDSGEPARAIELLTQGIRLDPRNLHETTLDNMGRAQFMNGDDDAATQWLRKALDVNPSFASSQAYLAMAYARKGDQARARTTVAALLRDNPKFSLSKFQAPKPGCPAAYREFWETKLLPAGRLAGLPE